MALVVETSQSFGRELLRGVTRYIREHDPWSVFFVDRAVCDGVPKWLKKWSGDGVISRISAPDVREFVSERGMPLVDLNEQLRGVGVPEEVAVVGVGNDDVACELASPPLSSVVLNAFQMGHEAATVLDLLMKGQQVDDTERLLPPLDVVTRQSSDVTAVTDRVVSDAVQFINEHACDGIKVTDVLRHVLVSRSVLQERFQKALDRSIHGMIVDVRIKRVKELLAKTELPLVEIALRTGFKHVEYLHTTFKRETDWTPATFREQYGRKPQRPFQIET